MHNNKIMPDRIFCGILVPYIGPPKLISLTLREIESVLNCDYTNGYTVEYLDYFGYHVTLFSDRESYTKNLPQNHLSCILTKEREKVYGNSIIIDDNKDLTIEDFQKIINIAKEIPSCTWVPEPEIKALYDDGILSTRFIKDIIRNSGSPEQREIIWNKIGKYYVPES